VDRRVKSRKVGPTRDSGLVTTSEAFLEAKSLFAPFFTTSKVGFGICDDQLRYQAVNGALAATNRIPAEAHLGKTVRDVLGEVAGDIEPLFERVLATRRPVLREITGRIPTRPEVVHWIANHFPVKDSAGRVRHLGAIVVEVTEQRTLQESLRVLGEQLLHTKAKEQRRIVRELHTSISGYHTALKNSLRCLVRPISQPADRADLLAQSVKVLEHFPVVSLKNAATTRLIFQQVEQSPKVRDHLFARMADSPELQREVLEVLVKHPELQNSLINELAKTLKFRRWLLRLANRGI
jgi:PAS fold